MSGVYVLKKLDHWDKNLSRGIDGKVEILFQRVEKRLRTPATQDVPLTARTRLLPRMTLQPLVDHVFY